MLTKQDVKAGTVLISEQPFVYILNSKLRTLHCDYCFNKAELLKCSGCQYVHYCGRNCQRSGWVFHKHECQNLKNVAPRVVPDAARLMARLIKKLEKGGDMIRSYYMEDKFRTFKDLMSHYSDLKIDQKRMEHFASICGVLFEFLGDSFLPNSAELMGIYGRMCVNSFNICDQELKSLGTGIYLGASIIDHSCEPNAVATFEGTTLFIRSLKEMQFVNWMKIFISYIDVLNLPQTRQDELQLTYYFLCKCPRCIDDEIVDIATGAACPNIDCDGCVNMNNSNDNEAKCSKCMTYMNQSKIEEYKEVTELTETHLQCMKDTAYLDVCKVCLKRQRGVLYRLNLQHVKILDLTFESSIDFQQWDEAKKIGTELIDGYLYYYGKLHPLTGLLYLKLGKILLLLNENKEAAKYLKNAHYILKITHGITSKLFTEQLLPLLQQINVENGFLF